MENIYNIETIGVYLKRQREMRNIPLSEVAKATKINLRFLSALEMDDLQNLPGPTFAKGFVRSYAKAVGLDPEETMLQLEEHLRAATPLTHKHPKFKWGPPEKLIVRPWMFFVVFLTVVVVAAYFTSQ